MRALLYGARDGVGRVVAVADVFPAPLDAQVCAPYLLTAHPQLRRALAVGESLDAMSRLRELLGQSRCSTALAFDARQALDLIPLVRPEYVLIDLAMPSGSGFELLADLSERAEPSVKLGVTWSQPLDDRALRAVVSARTGAASFGLEQLLNALPAA